MVPGAGEAAHVDGLPSGQGRGVGQDGGELLAVARAQGIAQAGLDLADVGLQLGGDGGGAEAAVQQPDRVGLALQGTDHDGVDVARGGDLPQQVGLLSRPGARGSGWPGGGPDLAGCQAHREPGRVGHVQAVGDALEDMFGPMARLSRMISLTRPWAMPVAVAIRVWLSPAYWRSSRNSAPMSRLARAWRRWGVPRTRPVWPGARTRLPA